MHPFSVSVIPHTADVALYTVGETKSVFTEDLLVYSREDMLYSMGPLNLNSVLSGRDTTVKSLF